MADTGVATMAALSRSHILNCVRMADTIAYPKAFDNFLDFEQGLWQRQSE